jgi:hypothetical protein
MDPPAWAGYPRFMAAAALPMALSSGTVLVLITLFVAPIAAIAFARSGPAWKSIGKGPLALEEPEPGREAPGAERERALRDEIRSLVLAANERRTRRGEPPLDVETETRRRLADLVGS